LFVSTLPVPAFTASDVLDLYLHRGSFETVLADEDVEQNMDRWYSHTSCGQEFSQILAQWIWNLRLELGQKLSSSELRTTEFAQANISEPEPFAKPVSTLDPACTEKQTPPVHTNLPSTVKYVSLRRNGEMREREKSMGDLTRAANHLTLEQVKEKMKEAKNPRQLQRWQVVYTALLQPRKAEEIAMNVGVSKSLVQKVISRYNREGISSIEVKSSGGRYHEYLTKEEEEQFLSQFFSSRRTRRVYSSESHLPRL
jgi:hypothetical protein